MCCEIIIFFADAPRENGDEDDATIIMIVAVCYAGFVPNTWQRGHTVHVQLVMCPNWHILRSRYLPRRRLPKLCRLVLMSCFVERKNYACLALAAKANACGVTCSAYHDYYTLNVAIIYAAIGPKCEYLFIPLSVFVSGCPPVTLQSIVKGLIDKRRAAGEAWDGDAEVRTWLCCSISLPSSTTMTTCGGIELPEGLYLSVLSLSTFCVESLWFYCTICGCHWQLSPLVVFEKVGLIR